MYQLKTLAILLLLIGYVSPSFAAVDSVNITACSVFSDSDDKKTDGESAEEEEPDCE